MTGRKLLIEAQQLILRTLDEHYPNKITLDDRDMGFYKTMGGSEVDDRRQVLSDAFLHLKNKGIIEYSSPDHSIPRYNLRLTPEGALRVRNPVDAYKKDGIKAFIKALVSSIVRIIERKFNA